MRGFELNILTSTLIVLAVIVFAFLIAHVSLFSSNIETFNIRRDVYVMSNALEYGSIVADASFLYSFNQGCLDYLSKGGNLEQRFKGYSLWYDNGVNVPDKEAFVKGFEKEILSVLNQYSRETYDYILKYSVQIPQYTSVTLEEQGSTLNGIADSPDLISVSGVQRAEIINIQKIARLKRDFPMDCIKIYDDQKSRSQQLGIAAERVVAQEAQSLPYSGSIKTGFKEEYNGPNGNDAMGKDVLLAIGGKNENEIAESIKQKILKILPATDGIYEIKTSEIEFSVDVEPTCTFTQGTESSVNCNFKYNIIAASLIEVSSRMEDAEIAGSQGGIIDFYAPKLATAVKIERSFGSSPSVLVLDGEFNFDIDLNDKVSKGNKITFSQGKWSIPYQRGEFTGDLVEVNGQIRMDGVPIPVDGETYSLSFMGDIGSSQITGHVAGLSSRNLPVSGVFTAKKV